MDWTKLTSLQLLALGASEARCVYGGCADCPIMAEGWCVCRQEKAIDEPEKMLRLCGYEHRIKALAADGSETEAADLSGKHLKQETPTTYKYLVAFFFMFKNGEFGYGNTTMRLDHDPPTRSEIRTAEIEVKNRAENSADSEVKRIVITGIFRLSEDAETAE